MLTTVTCPYCHRKVTTEIIELCPESLCIKTCEVSEADPSLFDSLFGDIKAQKQKPQKKTEDAPVDFWGRH